MALEYKRSTALPPRELRRHTISRGRPSQFLTWEKSHPAERPKMAVPGRTAFQRLSDGYHISQAPGSAVALPSAPTWRSLYGVLVKQSALEKLRA